MYVIHYHRVTGHISQHGTGDSKTSHFQDHEIARLADVHHMEIDPTTQKWDSKNRCLVAKTPTEQLGVLQRDVTAAIARELAATDQFMVVDRPLSDATRAAWQTYRKGLRDISKQHAGDLPAQLRAWPARPDGNDHAAHLRARLAEILKGQ